MVGRKRLPIELEDPFIAFGLVLDEVEPAKVSLTQVVPGSRVPGRPFPDALLEFENRLRRARTSMPRWRRAEIEDIWGRCDDGLEEALHRARVLREEAPALAGFEGLVWAVERLIDPLEPFEQAARRFRELRTGRR